MAVGPFFLIRFLKRKDLHSRFGFVVSKKVSKKAVERNYIKRRLREIVRSTPLLFGTGYDYVFIVKKNPDKTSFAAMQESVRRVIGKIT